MAPSQGKDLALFLKQVIVLQKTCQIPHLPLLVCLEVLILMPCSQLRASVLFLKDTEISFHLPCFRFTWGKSHYSLKSPRKAPDLSCSAMYHSAQTKLARQPCSQKTFSLPQEAEDTRFCTMFSSLFLLYQTSAVHSWMSAQEDVSEALLPIYLSEDRPRI